MIGKNITRREDEEVKKSTMHTHLVNVYHKINKRGMAAGRENETGSEKHNEKRKHPREVECVFIVSQ